ncbi:hypothetical protein RHAB21_02521 [Pseudorhizobium halotolerans]|uniref:DUF2635 domain-containing protein n=1 Tax=Pseudorhizobium halotolerans TaxID=1233081 RepID=A0ABM8PLF4_9HYPH|nr:hypothetical protein [Pseudorhizobium halotolerans]CAD7036412.1 hypothetical protein RHAB21_02521 [Pseudorhizobium halotolerans]
MTNLYRPKQGLRIPLPGRQGEWPKDGRPVDFSSAYEARLVKDGDLVLIETDAEPEKTGGKSGGQR